MQMRTHHLAAINVSLTARDLHACILLPVSSTLDACVGVQVTTTSSVILVPVYHRQSLGEDRQGEEGESQADIGCNGADHAMPHLGTKKHSERKK